MAQSSAYGSQVQNVGFPPFATETFGTQIFWLALTFACLYFFVARVIAPKLEGIISRRRDTLSQDLEQASQLQQQAQLASETYDKSIAQAREKARFLAQETRNHVSAQSESRRKALESDINIRLEQASGAIREAHKAAMAHIDGIAAQSAITIVERLTGYAPTPEDAAAAVVKARL
jgi:F-type H+-transporting ATPase subunit b